MKLTLESRLTNKPRVKTWTLPNTLETLVNTMNLAGDVLAEGN